MDLKQKNNPRNVGMLESAIFVTCGSLLTMPMFVLGVKDNYFLLLTGTVGLFIFIVGLIFFYSTKNVIIVPNDKNLNSGLNPITELDIARIRFSVENESMRRQK